MVRGILPKLGGFDGLSNVSRGKIGGKFRIGVAALTIIRFCRLGGDVFPGFGRFHKVCRCPCRCRNVGGLHVRLQNPGKLFPRTTRFQFAPQLHEILKTLPTPAETVLAKILDTQVQAGKWPRMSVI